MRLPHEQLDVVLGQKGSDSIGWIDTESNLLVDAIYVGDEPSNMIDGQAERAYVALATESAVAVVDIAERRVVDRWTAADPMAMALSADESFLCRYPCSGRFLAIHLSRSTRLKPSVISLRERPTAVLIPHLTLVAPSMACSLTDGSIFLSSVDGNPSAALVDTEDQHFHRVKESRPLAPAEVILPARQQPRPCSSATSNDGSQRSTLSQ